MINRRNCIKKFAGLFGAAAAVSANATENRISKLKKDEYDVVIFRRRYRWSRYCD